MMPLALFSSTTEVPAREISQIGPAIVVEIPHSRLSGYSDA
jgi:hypothetical protein